MRLFSIIDNEIDDPAAVKEELQDYLKDHRLTVEVRTVALDFEKVILLSVYFPLSTSTVNL